MDPTNVPIELISYRGLLKFFEGYLKKEKYEQKVKGVTAYRYYTIVEPVKRLLGFMIFTILTFIEKVLFLMMNVYDDYVYTPLQMLLSPIVKQIPRYVYLQDDKKIPIFTANLVTLSRTFLVIPIAWFLKYDYNYSAFFCVVFHDFLDHLDGIVAKVQRQTYPNHDDPILGGFLDAFCDKIVNVLSIWSIMQAVNFDLVTNTQAFLFIFVCYAVMGYESVIGIVRVQDFFSVKFKRDYKIDDLKSSETADSSKVTAAAMEGKLKEKLESTGIALLCLSVSKSYLNPINSNVGIAGLICLGLSLRMAHKSLMLKIKARNKKSSVDLKKSSSVSADNILNLINLESKEKTIHPQFENAEMKMVDYMENNKTESSERENEKNQIFSYQRRRGNTFLEHEINQMNQYDHPDTDKRVDKVYTIGCFDLFHQGHVKLIQRMRNLGKRVIVGVHDSRSIYKLKNRVPVDSTEKRMLNVKTVADEVFCIAGTDPSAFISSIVNLEKNETALYVRGDDMKEFPSREVVETLMPIKFLPYTEGVSSTKIRKEKFSHIAANDLEYLEKLN